MPIISSGFVSGLPGDCPICGAANSSCKGNAPDPYVPPTRLDLRQTPMGYQFLSREQVWWTNPKTAQDELRYGEVHDGVKSSLSTPAHSQSSRR